MNEAAVFWHRLMLLPVKASANYSRTTSQLRRLLLRPLASALWESPARSELITAQSWLARPNRPIIRLLFAGGFKKSGHGSLRIGNDCDVPDVLHVHGAHQEFAAELLGFGRGAVERRDFEIDHPIGRHAGIAV